MSEFKPLLVQKSSWFNSLWNKHKLWLMLGLIILLGVLWIKLTEHSTVFNYAFRNPGLKADEGRINVLLLGIAGGKHEGSTLTDTIMVASYDLKTKNVDLISLPRDIWLDEKKAKINTLYQTGLKSGDGLAYAQNEIGKLLGIVIPYGVRVDFSGFVKAVDLVDGVDVEVPQSFDDYEYPIEGKESDLCGYTEQELEVDEAKSKELNIPQGKQKVYLAPDGSTATDSAKLDLKCRYEHISFKQGTTHLDGETALKFVRSRHGTNKEGSDFSRSRRQQLVISAFKQKALSLDTLTDLSKITGLLKTFGVSFSTNIPQNKYVEFANLGRKAEKVSSHVVDYSGDNPLLINPDPKEYGGGWVLIPPQHDFSQIQRYVDDVFSGNPEATQSAKAQ